ncbi:hypothetical protein LguiB_016756 [Lonicera macranthoides]
MDSKMTLIVAFVVTFSLVVPYATLASKGRILRIEEEDQELERELKILNKPAVKTIKKAGKIYDCVNIYKQPALDHPLLKNHRIEIPRSSTKARRPINMELVNGCPKGTVVIARTTKEELLKAKSLFNSYKSNHFSLKPSATGYDFAGIEMKVEGNKKYQGAEAHIKVEQPSPNVQKQQYSAAIIRLQSGHPSSNSFLQTGWMVNPDLYPDNKTRFHTLWSDVSNGKVSGCFNQYCSGFVITNPQAGLDLPIVPVSVSNKTETTLKISISQNQSTGNWWLRVADIYEIGYWPKEIFGSLDINGAEKAAWGGLVHSDTPTSPPMGSGTFVNGRALRTAYMNLVQLRENGGPNFVAPNDTSVQVIESRCYLVSSYGYANPTDGYTFFYGGKGGDFGGCK